MKVHGNNTNYNRVPPRYLFRIGPVNESQIVTGGSSEYTALKM